MSQETNNQKKAVVKNNGFFKDYLRKIVILGLIFSIVNTFQRIYAGDTTELVYSFIGVFLAGCIIAFIWYFVSYIWGRLTGKIPAKTKTKNLSKK